MTKLKNSIFTKGIIEPNLYYVWTYKPRRNPNARQYITEKALYRKHYLRIPFFTRYHAKRTLVILFGSKVLSHIHIVKGKSLIKKGITYFPRDANWDRIFIGKKKSRKVKQFIVPPEYIYDKHRRMYYRIRLHRSYHMGKKQFDYFYALTLYGYREGFTRGYTWAKRRSLHRSIFQEIRQAQREGQEEI